MNAVTAVGSRGPQVCELAGITYRQLDYWARVGLVRPSITEAQGSGTQRRYSLADVAALKVVGQLRQGARLLSIDWPLCGDVVELVRQHLPELGPDSFLLVDSVTARYTDDPLDLAALSFATEPIIAVPLWAILRELLAPVVDPPG